jgi:hypothetical protein
MTFEPASNDTECEEDLLALTFLDIPKQPSARVWACSKKENAVTKRFIMGWHDGLLTVL